MKRLKNTRESGGNGPVSRDTKTLVAFMNAFSRPISGGDVCFIELMKFLDEFQKTVVTSEMGAALCREHGLEAEYCLTTREVRFERVIWIYARRMVRALRLSGGLKGTDVFYGTSDFLPDVLPAFWCRRGSRNSFWIQKVFHLIPPGRRIPYVAQRISLRLIKGYADAVIVTNGVLKEALVARGFDPAKVHVSPPGITVDGNPHLKTVRTKNKAMFLGRYHESKGVLDLPRIWMEVVKQRPGAKLVVVGDGSSAVKRKLHAEIHALGLEEFVEVTGYLDQEKVLEHLSSSSVFVSPSREEGFGIAMLEALAHGVPVVAWDLPVYGDFFFGGLSKVPENNIGKFAQTTAELLGNDGLRQELSAQGKRMAAGYSWMEAARLERDLMRGKDRSCGAGAVKAGNRSQ